MPDLSALASSHDILTLGMLADDARRQRHGLRTTFLRVAALSAEPGASSVFAPGAGEVRLLGAPASSASAIARIAEVAPHVGDVPLSGFSLADLEQLAAREQVTLRALLESLHAAGLEMVDEAPFDRLQDPRRSIEEVNIAGLALGRLTIHQKPSADLQPLFASVVALQKSVAVIRAFAPLPRKVNPAVPTTGYDDVKSVALARLLVDNISSIQVDWALYGPKLAQVALTMGADDIDGVSPEHDTSEGVRRAPLEEVRRNIRAAGFEPAERGGRFDVRAAFVPAGRTQHQDASAQ